MSGPTRPKTRIRMITKNKSQDQHHLWSPNGQWVKPYKLDPIIKLNGLDPSKLQNYAESESNFKILAKKCSIIGCPTKYLKIVLRQIDSAETWDLVNIVARHHGFGLETWNFFNVKQYVLVASIQTDFLMPTNGKAFVCLVPILSSFINHSISKGGLNPPKNK